MPEANLDTRLDPRALDASRGLERLACDWALFGLALDPDDWLATDAETQRAISEVWCPKEWHDDHPGALHGLIVGARAEIRSLAKAGVRFRERSWADLGGADGHYAIALILEGAAHAELIDEDAPRPLARAALDALRIRVRVEDATDVRLPLIDGVLALYSIDPELVVLTNRSIETVLYAPAGERGPKHVSFDTRVLSWSTRFRMGEGACALSAEPERTSIEVRERVRSALRPAPTQTVGDLASAAIQRLTTAIPGQPPTVASRGGELISTGVTVIDVGLGGLVRGSVHLVTCVDTDARLAVLTELALAWPHHEGVPALLATRAGERALEDAVLASATGVPRTSIARGALDAHDVQRLLDASGDVPIRIAGGIAVAADLDPTHDSLANATAIFADVETLDAAAVAGWEELAGSTGLTIVLGADPRSPGVKDHTLPELRLVPTAQRDGLVRYAGRGARVDGELSARIVCDVDAATLSLYVYEPPSDYSELAAAPPLGQQFDVLIHDIWVLR